MPIYEFLGLADVMIGYHFEHRQAACQASIQKLGANHFLRPYFAHISYN